MNILISGGTGFIGKHLCNHLKDHNLIVITRNPNKVPSTVKAIKSISELTSTEKIDIAINLAGEPIANKRWTDKQKQEIEQSRFTITQEFIDFFNRAEHRPKLFISGSAVGYYGIEPYGIGPTENTINESDKGDKSFSSKLCHQWEAIAMQATKLGIRTCLLRTGIVLGSGGGALNKMLLPFKLGLGGKIGTGSQWMPWIHIDDVIGIIDFVIKNETITGALNVTAPNPVTNTELTKTLGKILNRPTFFTMPAIIINLLMGQMGSELLLSGKKVVPSKLQAAGYPFKYFKLSQALSNC